MKPKGFQTNSRHEYLDSLRGFAAILVVINHYVAAFYPPLIFGGGDLYNMNPELGRLFFLPPLSLLTAGHFAVCIFFILSGYVLSFKFIGARYTADVFIYALVKRPFRLGGIVLITVFISALLWSSGLYFNVLIPENANSAMWLNKFWNGEFKQGQFLIDVCFNLFSHCSNYNAPLWTIKMELYGSFMVFAYLLVFSQFKHRWVVILMVMYLLSGTLYMVFFIGVLLADINKYHHDWIAKYTRYFFFPSIGLSIFLAGYPYNVAEETLGRTVYSIFPIELKYFYPILAATLLFVIVLGERKLQQLLAHSLFLKLGNISYSVYAIHFLILGSFSSWLFININVFFGYDASFLIMLIVSFIVITGVSAFLQRFVDEPSQVIANRVGAFVKKRYITIFNGEERKI